MKTIEERAKAFCENNICVDCGDRKNCDRGCVGCCIPTFSALERNPSSIIPYDLGHIDNDGNWVDSWCGSPIDDKIIGWREIQE